MSYNQRTHERVGAFQVSSHVVRLGISLARFCGGPKTDHPCSLPASPDTSDAGDVIRRCPPQGMQYKQRTFNHFYIPAQCPTGFWVWRSIGSLASNGTSFLRPFQCGQFAWTTLFVFQLRAAGDATRHFDVVTDRGHTDPVKNGDAFERLGIMTILADRMNTVKGSDNLSYVDDREMPQLHGHSFDEWALSGVGIPQMSAYTRVLCYRWNLYGPIPRWFSTLTLCNPKRSSNIFTDATFLVLCY